MQFKYFTLIILSIFLLSGCSDDDGATGSLSGCSTLLADMLEKSTAFTAGVMSGAFENATDCTDYIAAAQAYLDEGCTMCQASAEACADDGSNAAVCCAEMDQAGIDQMSAICN